MGKVDLAINLAKRTANFVKNCGKESVLMTRPQNIAKLDISGLKLAKPLRADVCTFSKDPTMAPELLEDLLHVKGSQMEKAGQIKDRFLRVMGYKNPELVRLDNDVYNMDLAFDFLDGTLSVGHKNIPAETLVAAVRHELDHLDKFAKLVKKEGVETVENSLMKGLLKYFSKVKKPFDRNFWLKMSKDADITDFDSKKYIEALENYRYDVTMGNRPSSLYDIINGQYLYCTNELEKSAYAVQKKVLNSYRVEDAAPPDLYGGFGKVKNLLENYGAKRDIYEPKGFKGKGTFNELYSYAISKSEPLGVEHLKYICDILNKKVEPNQEKLQQIVSELNAIEVRVCGNFGQYCKVFDTVYDWLKQCKFTLNDIDLG